MKHNTRQRGQRLL